MIRHATYIVYDIRRKAAPTDPTQTWINGHKADGTYQRMVTGDEITVGWMGQVAFSEISGLPNQDTSYKSWGDGGGDFLPIMECGLLQPGKRSIDIKTARKPVYLICEEKCARADFFVLARYRESEDAIEFIGWERGEILRAAPKRKFKLGPSYYIHNQSINPDIDSLLVMIWRGKSHG
jgi:hypothetical protein